MNLKVIITGTTGMVGEGVLHECLQHLGIENILVINRRPCGVTHPKLSEIIHPDFMDITTIESKLTGYDACFFCLGISSVGLNEADYTRMTYTLTMHVAQVLSKVNPKMTFCYVSGASTDSTEKGKVMWARVKGKTENDLISLPFKAVYNFRPAVIRPTKGLKNTLVYYKYLGWLLPVIKWLAPNYITSLKELGIAMINVVLKGYPKKVLEVKDIRLLAG
jgi:nucleoside-diphosphate-sugar epimerase